MRKQKLEMIGDADLDRVIGGTGVAQIGQDWMASGVIGAQSSLSSLSSLSSHTDSTRAGHSPGFAGSLGFLPSGSDSVDAAADAPADVSPENAGQFTEEPQDVYQDVHQDVRAVGYHSAIGGMDQGGMDQGNQVDQAQVDQGFVGILGFLPTTGGDDVNADAPSGLVPVNAGQLTVAPQNAETETDDYGDDSGCGDGGGDGSGGGNGDGMGGGGGGGGGDGAMGVMTCGFQDNDMPTDPQDALDDLINELGDMGGCGDNGDAGDADTTQQGNDQVGNPDPATIAPHPGLGQLR